MSDIGVKESVGSRPPSSVEVVGVAGRRRFSSSYKRRILDEVGRAGRGEIGLILRREGLYSSQLSQWRDDPVYPIYGLPLDTELPEDK